MSPDIGNSLREKNVDTMQIGKDMGRGGGVTVGVSRC